MDQFVIFQKITDMNVGFLPRPYRGEGGDGDVRGSRINVRNAPTGKSPQPISSSRLRFMVFHVVLGFGCVTASWGEIQLFPCVLASISS